MSELRNFKRTVIRLGSSESFSAVIPIPKKICEVFNIKPGDVLFVHLENEKIIVSKEELKIKKQEMLDSNSPKELESIESVW